LSEEEPITPTLEMRFDALVEILKQKGLISGEELDQQTQSQTLTTP
jgi:hypothetical protein